MLRFSLGVGSLLCLLLGCAGGEEVADGDTLFRRIPGSESGVDFENRLTISEQINPYTYRNFYNGAGVGLGDFDGDGDRDLFFTGNQVDNGLFWNQGDGTFIRDANFTGGADSWCTGVAVVDINADGYDDLYVCKSGPPAEANLPGLDGVRHNELFVSRGDGTFHEQAAAYGLDFSGLAVHATFFDYDQDGDLDVYLLSNSNRSVAGYDLVRDARQRPDTLGGNRLLRCDWPAATNGQIRYVDVSAEADIYRSAIGFGLGVTAGDVDGDGRTDLFVSNDYFERDYLYYNRGGGRLEEALPAQMPEISLGSMGADLADLDNDGRPELFVTEMLPGDDRRYKTKASFQPWNRYQLYRDRGYHQQFSRNVLQWNRGGGRFSEVGRLAGVEATDWSWGALLFDADGDGYKDIFVANGIGKDLLDQDYLKFDGNPEVIRKTLLEDGQSIVSLFERIPSEKLANGVFRNRGGLRFEAVAAEWGLDRPAFSNGAAYGDLDEDGKPDLVVSNIDDPAFVYRNGGTHGFLRLELEWVGHPNRRAIGAKVYAYGPGGPQYAEVQTSRGFQSSVDNRLFFGAAAGGIDSLLVIWPDGQRSRILTNEVANYRLERNTNGAANPKLYRQQANGEWGEVTDAVVHRAAPDDKLATSLVTLNNEPGVEVRQWELPAAGKHEESNFIDFNQDDLLFWSVSNEGPALAISEDQQWLYRGGAAGAAGQLLRANGQNWRPVNPAALETTARCEDVDAAFFDADGDGDEDLYVCSGGYEFGRNNTALLDQLYINEGTDWRRAEQLLPHPSRLVSSSCVVPFDADDDGDIDLFVGGRLQPGRYGLPATSYLLVNDGTGRLRPTALGELGLVTAAELLPDGRLLVAGEFMPLTLLSFGPDAIPARTETLPNTRGLWYALAVHSGAAGTTIFAGNHGLNSRLRATPERPLVLVVADFDGNGDAEQLLCRRQPDGRHLPLARKDELVAQLPGLRKQMPRYEDYAGKTLEDMFAPETLERATFQIAETLASLRLREWGGERGGEWVADTLPLEAQLQPVYALAAADLNADARPDVLLGGNQRTAKPELGIYDAGFGQLLLSEGEGFRVPGPHDGGLDLRGQIRALVPWGTNRWLVGRNDDTVMIVEVMKSK